MEIGKSYEIKFSSGDKTTVKLINIKKDSSYPFNEHYKLEYLENETRKPVTPNKGENHFHLIKKWIDDKDCLTYNEISN